ncbi:hypothetical protein [Rothia nasimurium]|uniref:hypothetical protein n=1 Tax=Rothia nasimurium TaxID=85336 RepID=UPI001FD4EA17|nr:hypothetical protein [Rothia nasimurium]
MPELWGGSADLAGSNNTTIDTEKILQPESRSTKSWTGHPYGRVLHFGIREHAAAGYHQRYRAVFAHPSFSLAPSLSLPTTSVRPSAWAALMGVPNIFVWTHDSIGLGEDGPTHQPVEHLTAMRAIPNLDVVRPADGNETAVAWRTRSWTSRTTPPAWCSPART